MQTMIYISLSYIYICNLIYELLLSLSCLFILTPFLFGQGPGGVWCDVDVVEFSYFGAPAATPKEEFYTELVDGLRGSDPCLGSGSQVQYLSKFI